MPRRGFVPKREVLDDPMYGGKLVETGDVADIFHNPCHEYTKGLLRSIPKALLTAQQSVLKRLGTDRSLTLCHISKKQY